MKSRPVVQRIDHGDDRVQAAREAERRLFEHYGLEYRTHSIEIECYGVRLRVLEMGSGPPLIMVPGGSGEAIQFGPLMALMKRHRMIVINRPGGGMSDAIDHRKVNLRQLAVATLNAVLDAFELESAPFVASSMGGLWTLWLAIDHPRRVSEMVQFSCPALILGTGAPLPMRLLSVPKLNNLLFKKAQPQNTQQVRDTLSMLGCSKATTAALPEPFVEGLYRMFNLPTYQLAWLSLMQAVLGLRGPEAQYVLGPADLGQVAQPTRLVWGDNDVFGSVAIGQQTESILPNAELQVIAGSHVPFIDDPQECARLTDQFLQRHSGPPISIADKTRHSA